MRIILAVTLCLGLGACATFGSGLPTMEVVVGVYDFIKDPGVEESSTIEFRFDGTATMINSEPGTSPQVIEGEFSIVGESDGCILLNAQEYGGGGPEEWKICDGVLSFPFWGEEFRYRKRK